MALGAAAGSVVQLILRQGVAIAGAGLLVGLAGALALNRVMTSLLFGVAPTDVTTFAVVSITIVVVASVACLLPALRAAQVDPMVVLRDE